MSLNSVNITVKKEELLSVLKKNRRKHAEQFSIAKQGYKVEIVKRLRKHASQIASDKIKDIGGFDQRIGLPIPQDYTHVYDSLIGMLEMAQEEEMVIDGNEYRQWVEDNWDWSHNAALSNFFYTTQGALK